MDIDLRKTKDMVTTIRLRTWSLTLAIIISLIFYFLLDIYVKSSINWVDFILISIVQVVLQFIYFPDGELYGQKDIAFITNKAAYNHKASEINSNKKIEKLREYCKYEFGKRKDIYIENECGKIGIDTNELDKLKQLTEKECRKLKFYKTEKDNEEERIVYFSKNKKKKLLALLFKDLPVEPNFPETILSATENDGNKAIKDGSKKFKRNTYERKFFWVIVVSGALAYIGYTLRDGIGLEEITKILMYLTTLFTTAVMAFSSGETCTRVYKNRFYVDLANFIDGFYEWL